MTPPVVGPAHEVDQRLAVEPATVGGEEAAQLARRDRILEDLELLDVRVAVTAALEQEVALAEGAGAAEQGLGPERDRVAQRPRRAPVGRWSCPESTAARSMPPVAPYGRYSTPFDDGCAGFFGRAVPMRSR